MQGAGPPGPGLRLVLSRAEGMDHALREEGRRMAASSDPRGPPGESRVDRATRETGKVELAGAPAAIPLDKFLGPMLKGHGIEGKLPANHGTLVVGGPMVTAWVGVTPVAGHPEGVSGTDQSQSTSNGSNPFDVAARRKDI